MESDMKKEVKIGMVKVTIQREDRLKAITELCGAINKVAGALNQVPKVEIKDCSFDCSVNDEPIVVIDTSDDPLQTMVVKTEA